MEFLIHGHFLGPDGFEMSKLFGKDILRWCVHVDIFVAFVVAWLSNGDGKREEAMKEYIGIFEEGDCEG
jgi:hypothetical protein